MERQCLSLPSPHRLPSVVTTAQGASRLTLFSVHHHVLEIFSQVYLEVESFPQPLSYALGQILGQVSVGRLVLTPSLQEEMCDLEIFALYRNQGPAVFLNHWPEPCARASFS